MNYDECAPSTAPSVSSFPTSSNHPSWAPSSSPLPTLSTYPSSSPSISYSPSTLPTNMHSISIAPSSATGPQEALFDSSFGAPRCVTTSTSCNTGSLVIGRGTMSPGESNHPNTGSFHSDESNDRIVVKSSGAGALRAGNLATIEATVYAYSASADTADFFYAADATNPVWFYIGSAQPSGTGLQNISVTYTLPMGAENQAVRVQFRYGSSPSTNPCLTEDWNDRDDLVFNVLIPSSTLYPSLSPFFMQISESPSESHSLVPTLLESQIPSMNPSQTKSIMPSKMHSISPSETHSAVPSLLLSQSPSSQPSQISSLTPSTIQSDLPSESHSAVPSLLPSQSPSLFNPSKTPSQVCFQKGQKIKIEATSNEAIQVFEVQVLSENINVALGKTATQSSTFGSNNDKFGANNAVDGDLDTFIHTERTNSWWMVDLGALFSVESIHILNRWCKDSSDPHGCLCRLSNASVSLLDEDNDTVAAFSTNDTCGTPEVDISFITPCLTTSPSASPTTLSCLPNARIVKLHQPNTGLPIHVFEVKAMNSSGINILQGATATQSSTFLNNQDKFGANNAVDGDSDTFTHTKSESNPWWQVDLGDNYDVSSIEIMNRWCKDVNDSANCLCRLSGATISLVDDSGTEVTSISTGDTCGQANLEFVFESSPEFCQNTVSIPSILYEYK
eukprot:scaffold16627_cov93-Cyclotella_meneghiniana.AAC.3